MISFSSEWVIRTASDEGGSLERLFEELGRQEEEMELERQLSNPVEQPPSSAAPTSSSSAASCSSGDLIYGTDDLNRDLVYLAPRPYFVRNRELVEIHCPDLEDYGAFTRVSPGVYRYDGSSELPGGIEVDVPMVQALASLHVRGPDPTLSAWARFNARYGDHVTRFRPEDLVFVMRDLGTDDFLVYIAPHDYIRGYGELYPHWIQTVGGALVGAGFRQRSVGEFIYRGPDGPEEISQQVQANRVLREMGLEYGPRLDDMVPVPSDDGDEEDEGEATFAPRELIFARHGNIFFITPAAYFRQEGVMYDQTLDCEELDLLNFRQIQEGVYEYTGDSTNPAGLLRTLGIRASGELASFLARLGWPGA